MDDRIKEYQRAYGVALESLKTNKEVLAAFVFGSMVSGDLWEKSDIDFFVVLKKWKPGMTNVYSDESGKSVHYKFMSKKEFMNSKGFDLKGSFLHRLFSSSRMVYCVDKDIDTRFSSGRGYSDQARKIWTLAYFGKTIKGTEIKNATDFSMFLLAEANVATVTGDAFGNPNCIRFSYATSEDLLTEAMRRIKEALS